ncbi:MAG: primosomal replication protein N [Pseudomonadota bacterium]|nr:primosomal replication protein N [Pseudomonadota bacterium]
MNQVRIRAKSVAKSALRYTPAGTAVLEASLMHEGSVSEAGGTRKLAFEFPSVAVGAIAQALDREPLGTSMTLVGFIAPRTRRSQRLVVHIVEYEVFGSEINDGLRINDGV